MASSNDLPRAKLMTHGKRSLSDAELLAILIGTGVKDAPALLLAQRLLHSVDHDLFELGRMSHHDLMKLSGIGETKASVIIAAFELTFRRKQSVAGTKVKIHSSRDAFECFEFLSDLRHEEFWILLLDRAQHVVEKRQIGSGGVTGTVADTKLIFKYALERLATNIVLCHNHPSSNVQPSSSDIDLTRRIADAGKTLEIGVLDHVIVGRQVYYSFADEGIL